MNILELSRHASLAPQIASRAEAFSDATTVHACVLREFQGASQRKSLSCLSACVSKASHFYELPKGFLKAPNPSY